MEKYPKSFRVRFWSNYEIDEETGCWEWTGYKGKAGYGSLNARKISPGRPMYAHRVAWEIKRGPIPTGMHVLHKCDNPACGNPEHCFLGTQSDNNVDRVRKGRTASGDKNGARTRPERNPWVRNGGTGYKGEDHPGCKLSDDDVRTIITESRKGVRNVRLAERFKVSQNRISSVVRGFGRGGRMMKRMGIKPD